MLHLNRFEHSRRPFLKAAGAGLFGLTLPTLLQAEEHAHQARAKAVIFVMLFGGPSQLETFDLKPHAPEKIRGPFRPIACRTPGLLIGEHLPQLANISDKFTVVRTMSHSFNDHSGGGHYIQTGKRWQVPIGGGFNTTPQDWPAMGSVADRQLRGGDDLPGYFVIPNSLGRLQEFATRLRRPGEYGGWLGRGADPLTTAVEKRDAKDNPYWRDCTDDELTFAIEGLVRPKELTGDRLDDRGALLKQFDDLQRTLERPAAFQTYDRYQARALSLVASEKTRQALDITRESTPLRDRYGRNLFGQSCLMARRLIEAGSRYVTVHYDAPDGYGWDSHLHSEDVKHHLLPTFDQGFSALLTDLDERGMLAETLVVALGEMGRTPQPTGNWGRNHWSTLFPAVLAGGGIRRGGLYGESDKNAEYALTPPTGPEDLAATIYDSLGIDPELRLPDVQGRPVAINEGGRVLQEIRV
ncbi:MAG: DUF1501 domain-containing protein [Planctomycetota bacterium]|nr:MAG: DUF1501 domain-containing protein [Planctomycetota bacterium]